MTKKIPLPGKPMRIKVRTEIKAGQDTFAKCDFTRRACENMGDQRACDFFKNNCS